ncbi:DUF4845 domain-containing protein [Sessilibacter sp. MAH2]
MAVVFRNLQKQPCGKNSQLGLGMAGWLVVILLIGLAASQVFKLAPSYIDNYTIRSELKKLALAPGGVESLSLQEIRSSINNSFLVNGIRGDIPQALDVKKSDGRTIININYEKRIKMFYNIDAVMTFNNQLDSKFPNKCCDPIGE